MTDILIRNLSDDVILKIDSMAKTAKLSRNVYVKKILERHALSSELTEQRFMYEELVERLTAALEVSNELFLNVANELRDVKAELEAIRNG